MTRKFCDRCDTQSEKLVLVAVEGSKENSINAELCQRCWKELTEFFKPLPKVSKAEGR